MSSPVVLITGALTGIGRATALAFAKDGAQVVASGRREAEGKSLEAELRGLGAEAAFIRADVRHEDDVRNLVDQTVARFGRLDSAVNAAGTCIPTSPGPRPTIFPGAARTPARRSSATKCFPVFRTCSISHGSATTTSSPRTAT
jgi:NAD(P)-dependent dehydrogenase (short-subunit alcohol dehydrogenase family)